ncbi:hypothetical protein RGR07_09815 [Staphylococcus epidermidis]|uniref:hypothetical protein n=1 Tax=Staphylococcus epidermidis TaxID=1282 RepID=UPI003F88177C
MESKSNLIIKFIGFNFLILAVGAGLPFLVNHFYTQLVPNYKADNILYELIAFFVWQIISGVVNFLILKKIAKDYVKSKKFADIYKYILSIVYYVVLSLFAFMSIDNLMSENDIPIVTFLVTISFGNLAPTATFIFRNHTAKSSE